LVLFSVIVVALISKRDIQSVWYYVFYVQNFKLAYHNWDISTFPKWLNHTWTLAIEEQFYIFFPLLVRLLKEKALIIACLILIALSVFTRYYLSVRLPNNTISWGNTVSNLDFLSAGALLAIGIRRLQPKTILRFLWIAFGLTALAFCLFTNKPFEGPIYLTNLHGQFFLLVLLLLATATVLSLVSIKNRVVHVLFENRFAVYIGKISYGLYLYHVPFFLLTDYACRHFGYTQTGNSIYWWALVKVAGSLVIAGLSFKFFESRVMKLKQGFKFN